MKRKYVKPVIAVAIPIFLIASGLLLINRIQTQVREIFQYNEQRKSEGYYLAEMEFKGLGIAYYLDHGNYIKGISAFNRIHKKLKTTEGLIKIPNFSNSVEKLDFYRNLQNPKTGAFQDESYPLFSYIGVTTNMIANIEHLSYEANQPFSLKYPLRFLDEINTPEKIIAFLDDLSTVGWIGAKFKAPYVEIGELWELIQDAERLGIYSMSPEWKRTYLQWCYDNQDSETGLWGAKSRSTNKLVDGGDLTDSEKMLSKFVDSDGNDKYTRFPLKHRDRLFATTIEKLSTPMPNDRHNLHRWILDENRGLRILLRHLWQDSTPEEKEAARKVIAGFIQTRFEHYYIEEEGAFSLYPGSDHADLDGTGETISFYKEIGALSAEKQQRLWGNSKVFFKTSSEIHEAPELKTSDFTALVNTPEINSVRLYATDPDGDYLKSVEAVYYPKEHAVIDLADLLPKLGKWLKETHQNIGNWVSKEGLIDDYWDTINIKPAPLFNKIPVEKANDILKNYRQLIVVGFDSLQIPRYRIIFLLENKV